MPSRPVFDLPEQEQVSLIGLFKNLVCQTGVRCSPRRTPGPRRGTQTLLFKSLVFKSLTIVPPAGPYRRLTLRLPYLPKAIYRASRAEMPLGSARPPIGPLPTGGGEAHLFFNSTIFLTQLFFNSTLNTSLTASQGLALLTP